MELPTMGQRCVYKERSCDDRQTVVTNWTSTANHRPVCLRRKCAFGLAVTLTFDLLTSKCKQSIFVHSITAPKLSVWWNSHKLFS